MNYADFIARKERQHKNTTIAPHKPICPALFDFQQVITRWALKKGKCAIFADCGLGKTIMQLAWAEQVPGNVLIAAPLAVSEQTIREGRRFGIPVSHVGGPAKIEITNYERLHQVRGEYAGVVLDESSILKNYSGKVRNQIIDMFRATPYKLACTATPAPNDFMELGNHAEFLDVCSRTEMLAEYFVHDGGETQKWRLKGHAVRPFWKWVASWAVTLKHPSDIGFTASGYDLPQLHVREVSVRANYQECGFLFPMMASSLTERRTARKNTIADRARAAAAIIAAEPNEPWLVWCNLNNEADAIRSLVPGAVEIRGSDASGDKAQRMLDFADGKIRVLVTKPSIAGFGMNWQHCHNVVFLGLSDSYEEFYQAIRRCWRFGQEHEVNAYVVTSDVEGAVVANIKRKANNAATMHESLITDLAKQELAR